MLTGDGMLNQDEVQSAMFEAIEAAVVRKKKHGIANDKYEIIRLLIRQGLANPHHYQTLGIACVDFDPAVVTTYSRTKLELNRLEQNDPILWTKPESCFQEREAMSAETIRLSIDAAMTSLFMLWTSARSAYGDIALLISERSPKVLRELLSKSWAMALSVHLNTTIEYIPFPHTRSENTSKYRGKLF
jgi:hypothetical protein